MTWTEIYNSVFGPSGSAPCAINGGCHTQSDHGFKCGTTKTTCYSGFVSDNLITPGSGASSSSLVDPSSSPLCGSLGGNMPRQYGSCVTAAELTNIQTWLAAGAPDN